MKTSAAPIPKRSTFLPWLGEIVVLLATLFFSSGCGVESKKQRELCLPLPASNVCPNREVVREPLLQKFYQPTRSEVCPEPKLISVDEGPVAVDSGEEGGRGGATSSAQCCYLIQEETPFCTHF